MTKIMPRYDRRYQNALQQLLQDPQLHSRNQELFREFFRFEEYKLKRINGLPALDDGAYKTLYGYIVRFRNVNRWFGNKPWAEITREDIQRVYDGLEDGTILNAKGGMFQSRIDYYNKVFKSKPFQLAGKNRLAQEVIEFARSRRKPVRFITESRFRRLIAGVRSPRACLLFWLAFDYGENIGSLLQLKTSDFYRQADPETGEPEYRLNFRPEILKRSRRARSELSNYPQTVQMLDEVLPEIPEGEPIFSFGYSYGKDLMNRAARRTGVVCEPGGERVTWKDLRSGMACDLLSKGWTREDVNARLGHTPSSTQIDAYINFLALERRQPKRKVAAFQTSRLREQLDQAQRRAEAETQRSEQLTDALEQQQRHMHQQMAEMKQILINELREEIDAAQRKQAA